MSTDGIIKDLADLRINTGKFLENIEKELIQKYRDFIDLEKATDIAKTELEEIHQISAEANSLSALVISQNERCSNFDAEIKDLQEKFESEISDQRTLWETEKREYDWNRSNETKKEVLERKREQEEFEYNKKTSRKKDADEYEAMKISLDK